MAKKIMKKAAGKEVAASETKGQDIPVPVKKAPFSYWHAIEIPLYIIAGIMMLSTISQVYSPMSVNRIIGIVLFVIIAGVVGYMAYEVRKNSRQEIGVVAMAGAWLGAAAGLVGGVLGIISYFAFPGIYAEAIQAAVQAGAPRETIETFMKIGVYLGIVTGPLIYGVLGMAVAAATAALVKIDE